MPRPKLSRTIQAPPATEGFQPHGNAQAGEVILSLEEYEAVRLVDFEGLDQSGAAAHMGISRQTFGRVLRSARFIVAKALVQGLQLTVTGGCYRVRGPEGPHGQGRGSGGQRRRHGCRNRLEEQAESTGGIEMNENNIVQGQGNRENMEQQPGAGQGRGQGQGRGSGSGRGKGGGQGRGRGLGGGKGDGSCRRSK